MDSSNGKATFLKKLVNANAFTEATLREELTRKDQELKKADFKQDNLRQKVDREKRINFNLTAKLQKEQAKNHPVLTLQKRTFSLRVFGSSSEGKPSSGWSG